jgi:hypothetical protein
MITPLVGAEPVWARARIVLLPGAPRQREKTDVYVSTSELALATATTVVGAIIGLAISYYFFRRGGAARPTIIIGMEERAHIDPATVGVKVEMKVGTTKVTNLLLLELVVTNRGPRDLVVEDANDPTKHSLRPRIELPPGVRALADPWNPDGSEAGADVRVARLLHDSRQVLFVHIHRLANGATSKARILCTYRGVASGPPMAGESVDFFSGFIPDVDVQPAGLLKEPPKRLKR